MPTPQITTINQLIGYFKHFADNHPQVNDFGYGQTSEIGKSREMQFPYLWVTHRSPSSIALQNRTQIPTYSFTFIFADRINQQENYLNALGYNSDNQQETISDCKSLMDDFLIYIQTSLNEVGVTIDNQEVSFEVTSDETTDKVSGVMFDLRIKTKFINCTTPLSGGTIPTVNYPYTTPSPFLTCATVTGCTSLQNFVTSAIDEALTGITSDNFYTTGTSVNGNIISYNRNDLMSAYTVDLSSILSGVSTENFYTTGATLNGNTISFNRNDLMSAYTINLSTLSPNLSGYFQNTGGTITGNVNVVGTISATTITAQNESWVIELMDGLTVDFYAPYAMKINSISNVLNSPSIALFDDGASYTLTNTISIGSKITVSANTASVILLNAAK